MKLSKPMKIPNLTQFPPPADIEPSDITRRARAQLNLRDFLRRVLKGKPMLDASAQKENLINKLKLENLLTRENDDSTKHCSIFYCSGCDLWQPSDRQKFRVHWNNERSCLEVFRICRACEYVYRKMNITLYYIDPPVISNPKKFVVKNNKAKQK